MTSPLASPAVAPVAGFRDPVFGAQANFRVLLGALSRPGWIGTAGRDLKPPAPLHPAAAGLALTLFDYDTPVWLDDAAATAETLAFLRFHCGCPIVGRPREARFAIVAAPLHMPPLAEFDPGTDEAPDNAATVVVQADALREAAGFRLSGPGIRGTADLAVAGLPPAFRAWRQAQQPLFPRGVDLVFTAGSRIAALPRTTRLED